MNELMINESNCDQPKIVLQLWAGSHLDTHNASAMLTTI